MIPIPLPGRPIELTCLLLDLNGTLTTDGRLLSGIGVRIDALRGELAIEIASGDTFGTADEVAGELGLPLTPLSATRQAEQKLAIVERLGAERTAMIGNGSNDALALSAAALGICVLGAEGAARAAVLAADIVVPDPLTALELLLRPTRLVASLRS
jgi:P-type E1-E2 ATPase